MSARLNFVGHLRDQIGGRNEATVEAGRTVRETLVALNITPEIVAMVIVNEQLQSKDYVIQEGDTVRLRAIIGGG